MNMHECRKVCESVYLLAFQSVNVCVQLISLARVNWGLQQALEIVMD